MKRTLAVVGLGTAGIQSLAHFLGFLNSDWVITSISDPKIPILGIGESTNPSFISTMARGAGLDMYTELVEGSMDSTVKYGTMYEKWRNKDFINPLIGPSVALHINTFSLKEWSLPRFREMWGSKFEEVFGSVSDIFNEKDKAVVVLDDVNYYYDFVIDCRGFPKSYEDYTIFENPTNKCFVHNRLESINPLHTKHVATKDGWMFVVPLKSRTSYGYLINSDITDDETAKHNFSKEINVAVDELDNISYSFKSYYHNKPIDGRIARNGNRVAFFEPMFANSIAMYDIVNRNFFDYIQQVNSESAANANLHNEFWDIKQTILFFYHGGSTFDTPFWDYTTQFSNLELKNDPIGRIQHLKKLFEFFELTHQSSEKTNFTFSLSSIQIICKNMGYDYKENFNVN